MSETEMSKEELKARIAELQEKIDDVARPIMEDMIFLGGRARKRVYRLFRKETAIWRTERDALQKRLRDMGRSSLVL